MAWVREAARETSPLADRRLGASGHASFALGEAPAGDYRLELSARPAKASGDFGVAFPAVSRCPYWLMGANRDPLPTGRWTKLVVERRGAWIRLWRDGALVASFQADRADGMSPSSDRPALGLWGSDVEVKEVRWRVWEP